MGIAEAKQAGKSIFFLLESDPGPGLGLLTAYALFGKGAAKSSSPGAIVIHFSAEFMKSTSLMCS